MMSDLKSSLVQVDHFGKRTSDYEETLQSSTQGESDLVMLENQWCSKLAAIKAFVGKGIYPFRGRVNFTKKVKFFPGCWTEFGDNSPVKHKMSVRCKLGNKEIESSLKGFKSPCFQEPQ